jgi:RHS repeat-associated protein
LAERLVYGEVRSDAVTKGVVGILYRHYHGAGLITIESTDVDGNVTLQKTRLMTAPDGLEDWSDVSKNDPGSFGSMLAYLDDAAGPLEATDYEQSATYDAQQRPLVTTLDDDTTLSQTYSFGGGVRSVDVGPGGATASPVLVHVDYNARGQRSRVEYANDVVTKSTYDPLTFRLSTLETTRWEKHTLADIRYTYDAVGQLLEQEDRGKDHHYKGNQALNHVCRYRYDLLHRLVEATGLEHASLGTASPKTPAPFELSVHPNDGTSLRRYTEKYTYDSVGNIRHLRHHWQLGTQKGGWRRSYEYEASPDSPYPKTNRLVATKCSSGSGAYTHDVHGNMTSMPHLPAMRWTWKDELAETIKTFSTDRTTTETGQFQYDPSGQRLRKRWLKSDHTVAERIYLGPFEVYREYPASNPSAPTLERTTAHVGDEMGRFLMVETKTLDAESGPTPPLYRYQLGDHIQSTSIELDGNAKIITEEAYHPYGTTAWWRAAPSTEVPPKRYRYTGMERDEETGLSYHSARYYAPWLGRWCAADPIGAAGGLNLFSYAALRPSVTTDRSGLAPPTLQSKEEAEPLQYTFGPGEGQSLVPEQDLAPSDASTGSASSPTRAQGRGILPQTAGSGGVGMWDCTGRASRRPGIGRS